MTDKKTPEDASDLPGSEEAWADRLVGALGKQLALSGKPTRRPPRANKNPLKKYNKQRGMLRKA